MRVDMTGTSSCTWRPFCSHMKRWYSAQVSMISTWLTERVDSSLHSVQLSALSQIVRVRHIPHSLTSRSLLLFLLILTPEQKMYSEFSLQGFEVEKLNSKAFQTVLNRIQMEEAAASVNESSCSREDEEYENFFSSNCIFAYS